MDRFGELNRVLDTCLKTELISQVFPNFQKRKGRSLCLVQSRWIQVECLDEIYRALDGKLLEKPQDGEFQLICRRVDKYLKDLGIDVKPIV